MGISQSAGRERVSEHVPLSRSLSWVDLVSSIGQLAPRNAPSVMTYMSATIWSKVKRRASLNDKVSLLPNLSPAQLSTRHRMAESRGRTQRLERQRSCSSDHSFNDTPRLSSSKGQLIVVANR